MQGIEQGASGAPTIELSFERLELPFIGSNRSAARAKPAASRRQESTPKMRRLGVFITLTNIVAPSFLGDGVDYRNSGRRLKNGVAIQTSTLH